MKKHSREHKHDAIRAVAAIEDDICNRKGLRQEWENIDEEIKITIRAAWASILADVFANADLGGE